MVFLEIPNVPLGTVFAETVTFVLALYTFEEDTSNHKKKCPATLLNTLFKSYLNFSYVLAKYFIVGVSH